MRIRVRLLGSLRPVNLKSNFEIELPDNSNLSTLITHISKKHHETSNSINSPSRNLIMINGVEVGNLKGLDTPLLEDSEVVFVPVTHGG